MAVPLFTKTRYRTVLLIAASVVVIAGAAIGTVLLLKHYGPFKQANTSETASDTRSPLQKAEDLYEKGDYAGAKTQYQSILNDYKSQKNEAAAKDIEMQIKVIDATASAPKAPQNTDRTRVTAGTAPKE